MSDQDLSQLVDRVDTIADIAIEADEETAQLQAELDALREEVIGEIEAIHERLDDLEDRTDPLQWAQQAGSMDVEEKAAICLMTLYERAQHNDGRAAMDAEGAVNALGGSIHRTSAYDVFRKAQTLVDDTAVCEFKKETRSAQKNSRLVVNLTNGDLPRTVAGYTIREGEHA